MLSHISGMEIYIEGRNAWSRGDPTHTWQTPFMFSCEPHASLSVVMSRCLLVEAEDLERLHALFQRMSLAQATLRYAHCFEEQRHMERLKALKDMAELWHAFNNGDKAAREEADHYITVVERTIRRAVA